MRSRAGGAAVAVLLLGACSGPAPPLAAPSRTVILSTTDTAANVGPVVTLFRQTCLDAAPDVQRMAAAVTASGWPVREMQVDNPFEPPIWRFDYVDLIWIPRPTTHCFLNLDSPVSPTPAALGAALRPFVRPPGFEDRTDDEDKVVWAWPAGGNRWMVLTIEVIPPSPGHTRGAGRQAVSLHLASEPMPAPSAQQE